VNRTYRFFSFAALLLLTACLDTDLETDQSKQLTKEVQAIDAYLRANVRDYIAYDQSGIRIAIQEFGELPPPHGEQRVVADVVGSLFTTNTVFADTILAGKLKEIVGDGLRYGISALLAGSKATLYIPSAYAYGTAGAIGIPPNATLVYTVNLKTVTRTATEQTQFQADTTAIKQFIGTNEIENAIAHPSGIWYTIDVVGTGPKPRTYDAVSFDYEGSLLASGEEFDDGTLTDINIFGLIDGFKVSLPLLRVGSTATVYIPSGLGYGPDGSGSIPSNAILKFKIKLTDIVE
jgi:FKBP-type peptidyl-prolyl cis-trans isomerase